MKIAVFGAGDVGATLGERFASLGHTVHFGVRNPQGENAQKALATIREKHPNALMEAGTVDEAAEGAGLVVLATPWDGAQSALQGAGDLGGKIIVDCTNPLRMGETGLELTLGYSTSAGETVAEWVPDAHVVKCFNTTGFGNMANPHYEGGSSVMFVCGDDDSSRQTVLRLANSIGFETIDAGPLRTARLLEPFAMLWIHLAFTTDLGRDWAFGILRR